MKYKLLNSSKNNSKLALFFNGWGMDDGIIKHLIFDDFDVVMFYDYNNLDSDFDFKFLNNYKETHLIAWSMGVMVASIINPPINGSRVAINGTIQPINSDFGIHPRIYDLTIKGFDENGRNKFINSMFNTIQNNIEIASSRTIENQLSELIALKTYTGNKDYNFNKILISDNDKIIPTKSQVKFWGKEPNLKSGHCPFFEFKKWSELL